MHVKAWLISSPDHSKYKTVFDLKRRFFIPGGANLKTAVPQTTLVSALNSLKEPSHGILSFFDKITIKLKETWK